MHVFPEYSLDVLPFTLEPISRWTHESDLMEFITTLLPYSEYFFDRRRDEFRVIADKFMINAAKAELPRSAKEAVESIPEFGNDEAFGLAAKYTIAWFIVTQALLEESAFFSLPHMLEAYSELECSFLLASNMYYKQALQVLRNLLENSVLQMHFCGNAEEFKKWKENDYQVPPLRGKSGMLTSLVQQGVLSQELATAASHLYGELNGCIHGAEKRLIHQGVFTGQYAGQIFKYARFEEWCHYLSRCTDFAIRAQYTTVQLWQGRRYQTGIICSVCHSPNLEVEDVMLDGNSTTTFRCRACGEVMRFSTEWLSSKGLI